MAKGSKRKSRYHGVVAVDKPAGMTSQDVVNVVRRVSGTRRVGHTGTLDPLATGLLIVLVGEATKLSEYMVGFDKAYEGLLRLGVRSDTHDITGKLEELPDAPLPSLEQLREATVPLTGTIDQVPPAFSAVKVQGRKLYEYARQGEQVEVESRQVTVPRFDIVSLEGNDARFVIECSSGTYVRSLVHELGEALGCGAVVAELSRTRVADFELSEAIALDRIRELDVDAFGEIVNPMLDTVTSWPMYHITETGRNWIVRGQAIPTALAQLDHDSNEGKVGELVFLCQPGKDAIAVARVVPAPPSRPPATLSRHGGLWLQPIKILTPETTE